MEKFESMMISNVLDNLVKMRDMDEVELDNAAVIWGLYNIAIASTLESIVYRENMKDRKEAIEKAIQILQASKAIMGSGFNGPVGSA